MLITFNGTYENGQCLGDQHCSLKAAWLFAQNQDCDNIIMSMSPPSKNALHFIWQKFIDTFKVHVVFDDFDAGNWPVRFSAWDKWRTDRIIDGRPFDVYKELYRRIDGGFRQPPLCKREFRPVRPHIFEYLYYGQEDVVANPVGIDHFGDELVYHDIGQAEHGVLIAPYAKCQGNQVFTFDYWDRVVRILIGYGIPVTVVHDGRFCEDLVGSPLYRKIFPGFEGLYQEIPRHRLVACGNTGVGWVAFACGVPVIAMQPVDSNMPDYRYEVVGCKSLVEIIDRPNAEYCARRINEEVNRKVVLTTGCYDVLHAGHVRHLEEARAMGTRLVVALNSDESVRRIKGEVDGVRRPVNTQEQRKTVLQAIRFVDRVEVFDGDTAIDLIKSIRPDVLACGAGYTPETVVGREFVESYGGRVAITCDGKPKDLSSTGIVSAILRPVDVLTAIRDAMPYSLNPWHKLKLLADQLLSVLGLPGDIADVGTYRGGCALLMQRIAPEKELHLFDTWAGNPHDDELCHHKAGEWATDLNAVKALLADGEHTRFHQGVFPETAADVGDVMFCFAYVDGDTYRTTIDAIDYFWPRMVAGGKMVFDDFGWLPCAGVEKAVREKFAESQITVYSGANACVVVKR